MRHLAFKSASGRVAGTQSIIDMIVDSMLGYNDDRAYLYMARIILNQRTKNKQTEDWSL